MNWFSTHARGMNRQELLELIARQNVVLLHYFAEMRDKIQRDLLADPRMAQQFTDYLLLEAAVTRLQELDADGDTQPIQLTD